MGRAASRQICDISWLLSMRRILDPCNNASRGTNAQKFSGAEDRPPPKGWWQRRHRPGFTGTTVSTSSTGTDARVCPSWGRAAHWANAHWDRAAAVCPEPAADRSTGAARRSANLVAAAPSSVGRQPPMPPRAPRGRGCGPGQRPESDPTRLGERTLDIHGQRCYTTSASARKYFSFRPRPSQKIPRWRRA